MLQGIKRALDEGYMISTVSGVDKVPVDKECLDDFNLVKYVGAHIGRDLEIGVNPTGVLRSTASSSSFFQSLENAGDKFLNRYGAENKKRMSLSGQGRIQNAFEIYGNQLFTHIEKEDGLYHLVIGSGEHPVLCTETKDFSRLFYDGNQLILTNPNLRNVLGLSTEIAPRSRLPDSAPGCRRSNGCREKGGLEHGLIPGN